MRNIYNALTDALEELGIYDRIDYSIVSTRPTLFMLNLVDKNVLNSILQLEVTDDGDEISVYVFDKNLFTHRVAGRICNAILDALT